MALSAAYTGGNGYAEAPYNLIGTFISEPIRSLSILLMPWL